MGLNYDVPLSQDDIRAWLYAAAATAEELVRKLQSEVPDYAALMGRVAGTGIQLLAMFVATSQDPKDARKLFAELIEVVSEHMRERVAGAVFSSQMDALAAKEAPRTAPPAPALAAQGVTAGERTVLAIARSWFRASRAYCLSFGPGQERAAAEVRDLAGKLYETMLQLPEFSDE